MKPDSGISPLTLGTAQIGLDYGIANRSGKPDEETAFRILESALGNGVNCIDTAAAYGDSEKIIGKFFRTVRKKDPGIKIVTKFSIGPEKASTAESLIMHSVEKSLMNLDTGFIDILLLHHATEYQVFAREISSTLEKLMVERIIRSAGASCYELKEIVPLLDNEIFSAFQLPLNLLDDPFDNNENLNKLAGKLIFARSIFLQGLFFMDPSRLEGSLRDASPYLKKINALASAMDLTVQELAVKYVRSLDPVDSLVTGAETPLQAEQNAKLVRSDRFDPAAIASIRENLRGAPRWITKPNLWYAAEKQ